MGDSGELTCPAVVEAGDPMWDGQTCTNDDDGAVTCSDDTVLKRH